MMRQHIRRAAVATTAVLAAAGLGFSTIAGPANADVSKNGKVPTFKEFKKSTFRDTNGAYVVNGDIPIKNTKLLKAYYEKMVHTDDEADHSQSLIVNTVYGEDDLWTASQAQNLTYCVSNSFGSDKSALVSAMSQGAALWENATGGAVNFTYVSSADGSCTTSNSSVVFSVEPTSTTEYIARAFFPSSPKSQRNVLVNADALQSSGSWTPGNILGHELGHTLGFRHEHTRPEAGTCFEDNNWRPLTPYDSASIMHYPQCNGSSDDLTFSSYDRSGVSSVY